MARVYGQALDRIARTELHLFRSRLQPRIEETTSNPIEALEATRQAAELLLPLADPLLLGVHRRKLEISAAMRPFGGPALHAGLHHGLAVFREGDYYGRAVNLASRLLNLAEGDELLATENVALAAEHYGWQHRARTKLLDFETEPEIFRLDLRSGAS